MMMTQGMQPYQNNPLGYGPFNMQFQQNPMMQMMQQFMPGMASRHSPFIPYNIGHYDFMLMQQRREDQKSMMTPSMPTGFQRLYGGMMQNIMGYNPVQTAQMMYAPGGGLTPMTQAMMTMYNKTIGPILQPEAYLQSQRANLLGAFQGLRIGDQPGGSAGFYGGLTGGGADQLIDSLRQNVQSQSGVLRGYTGADWADIARIGADYGVLTSSDKIPNLQDVTAKITKLGEVIKIGMGIFNTLDKSEVLDILQTISMGTMDVTNVQSAEASMARLATIAAKANKSIQFMVRVAQEGAALYKQIGYGPMQGAEIYTTMRGDFTETAGLSDEMIRRVGGRGAAFQLYTQADIMTQGSGLTRGIYGAYETIRTYAGGAAVERARALMQEQGFTRETYKGLTDILTRANVGSDVISTMADRAGLGMGRFEKDMGEGGKKELYLLQRTGKIQGTIEALRRRGIDFDDEKYSGDTGNARLETDIVSALRNINPGMSFDVASVMANSLVGIKGKGPTMAEGVEAYKENIANIYDQHTTQAKRRLVSEAARPGRIDPLKRLLSLNFKQAGVGDIFKEIFKGRETALEDRYLTAITDAATRKESGILPALSREGRINAMRGAAAKQRAIINRIGEKSFMESDEYKELGLAESPEKRQYLNLLAHFYGESEASADYRMGSGDMETLTKWGKQLFKGDALQKLFKIEGGRVALGSGLEGYLGGAGAKVVTELRNKMKDLYAQFPNKIPIEELFKEGVYKKQIIIKEKQFKEMLKGAGTRKDVELQDLIQDVQTGAISSLGGLETAVTSKFGDRGVGGQQASAIAALGAHLTKQEDKAGKAADKNVKAANDQVSAANMQKKTAEDMKKFIGKKKKVLVNNAGEETDED
jgi:hypothetical protein